MVNRTLLLVVVSSSQTAKVGIGFRAFLRTVNKTLLLLVVIPMSHYPRHRGRFFRIGLQSCANITR
jgi:hypothetical protein